jgi:hypothetical protein
MPGRAKSRQPRSFQGILIAANRTNSSSNVKSPSGKAEAMTVQREGGATSLIDVLDRVLDKGIVIDAYVRVAVAGIDLVTVHARVVVASIETYLKHADALFLSAGPHHPIPPHRTQATRASQI